MNSLEYIERELEWLRTGGNRQLDQDEEAKNLEQVKKDLKDLEEFRQLEEDRKNGHFMLVSTHCLYTMDKIQEENKKYKKIIEILKNELNIEVKECCDKYKKRFKKDYQITAYSHRSFISKENYNLFKEVFGE